MKAPFLIGRVLYGGFFIYSGIRHFQHAEKMAQYAAAKKVPYPEFAVKGSGALLVAGGVSTILGVRPKLGALALIAFLAGVSPFMHDFWNAQDEPQRMNDMVNFYKNLALLGAATALLGVEEPWEASVPLLQPSGPKWLRRAA
jgi:putative oxidoreductase